MHRLIIILILFSPLLILGEDDWILVWSDDFDDGLDLKKWDIETNCWGGGNDEKQCYVDSGTISVSGGSLHIMPIPCNKGGQNHEKCSSSQPSISGRLRTLKSSDGHWKYGKIEARAKLPKGNFFWPAIWMLPTDNEYGTWASSGEIDIMEFRGQDRHHVSHALHFGGNWPNNRYVTSGDIPFSFDFTEDYHIFGIEWDEERIVWSVDGQKTYEVSLDASFGDIYKSKGQPFDKRFHLIVNVAVGGNFFNPAKYGHFDISTASKTWETPMSIDYIKVYQKEKDIVHGSSLNLSVNMLYLVFFLIALWTI